MTKTPKRKAPMGAEARRWKDYIATLRIRVGNHMDLESASVKNGSYNNAAFHAASRNALEYAVRIAAQFKGARQ